MRLSTIFVSFAFVLAGISAAEKRNMLVARFADFDFFGEVEARAYGEKPELYAQGGVVSINSHKPAPYTSYHHRAFYDPPRYEINRRRNLPWEEEYPQTETHKPIRVANLPSKSRPSRRRSFYEPSRIEITRRRDVPFHPEFIKEYRKMFRDRNSTHG